MRSAFACLAIAIVLAILGGCPTNAKRDDCPYASMWRRLSESLPSWMTGDKIRAVHQARTAAGALDYSLVKADLVKLMTTSQPQWPADFGHYGPLMVRLAWHCAGSYRIWDGRGGCDGGRQRFEPERSWPDNTNLDKARALLQPIKLKYGAALSWGDLITLAGTTAISSMGGPDAGFCAGRVDDPDGFASETLGLSDAQQALAPCPLEGNCSAPLGANVIGLIYVDPHGYMGKPVPSGSAPHIRDVFGRMSMNDSETVALIGGGHAFGKTHGACPTGAGPDPKTSPADPWPGTCGAGPDKGKGANAYTSGFELKWTLRPTEWSNDYFNNLLDYDWKLTKGPGGEPQWSPAKKANGPQPPAGIGMLTTDVALISDPVYMELTKKYAADIGLLEKDFAAAWYKLMSRDMGPATRCVNKDAPPPQPFQNTLPPAPENLANFKLVREAIRDMLYGHSRGLRSDSRRGLLISQTTAPDYKWIANPQHPLTKLGPDMDADGTPYFGALFVQLAWQCASTFRATDFQGGCNGARIRLSPQKDWPVNKGMDQVLGFLSEIKYRFDATSRGSGALSWADLIVLAGTTALEEASRGQQEPKFCGGRVDAEEGNGGPEFLAPRNISDAVLAFRDDALVSGLTLREAVALQARLRSPARQTLLGFSGSYTQDPTVLSNEYFSVLLGNTWEPHTSALGKPEFVAVSSTSLAASAADSDDIDGSLPLYMLPSDLALVHDPELLAIAEEYASDSMAFLGEFFNAWSKVVNADRFDIDCSD